MLAMGTVGNPNPWAPYDNYRDCSQGICSIYCPQFCYLIFPPPPPSDDDSGTPFSPLIIAVIGVLASAFLLVSYYTIVTRYCRRRHDHDSRGVETAGNRDESSQDQWQVAQDGLDEALIKTITVCKYKKGDGLIEGTDCAVCLSEFEDNESLRLLPKCSHAFHLPCIDTWLKSQSNCPLCRANVVAVFHPSPPPPSQTPSALSMSSYEVERPPDDLVLVVDDQQVSNCHQQMVVVDDDPIQERGVDQYRRRSVSLGTFSPGRQLLISDILKFEEIDEYVQLQNEHLWKGVGSSKGVAVGLLRSPLAMKRSISAGGFLFRVNDKGKNSLLSN
ncbi:hypothetical protein C2S51_011297 [Perilla frutescens var. frutescens]|nr:hypothetical protein C2S51_011297 [Perilla frutescens var. frutescens]